MLPLGILIRDGRVHKLMTLPSIRHPEGQPFVYWHLLRLSFQAGEALHLLQNKVS